MVENEERKILMKSYLDAKSHVSKLGYSAEIEWQSSLKHGAFSEADFLRECAWVILCSGFRESVLRRKFTYISICFFDWESTDQILENKRICRELALECFNNPQKIDAIIDIANLINVKSFSKFKKEVLGNPFEILTSLPFIGPVTVYHLTKNLGFSVAKPDRHLMRIAKTAGFSDVQLLCENIAQNTSDSVQVVDLVLWRFATLVKNYEKFFHLEYEKI